MHPRGLTPATILSLQRATGNAAAVQLVGLLRSMPQVAVQRMVEYDGKKSDESTMALDELDHLIRRVHRDGTMEVGAKGDLLVTLTGAYERRRRGEVVVVPKGGLAPAPTAGRVLPPKALPPLPPPKPAAVTVAVSPTTKPAAFDTEPIMETNHGEVVHALAEWAAYADAVAQKLQVQLEDKAAEKKLMKGAYYDRANAQFRDSYKTLSNTVALLAGAKSEAETVKSWVEARTPDRLDEFVVLRRSGRLVAVAEWVRTYIANIISDPRSLVPEEGREKPSGGVARAVIAITVLKSLRAKAKGDDDEITLFALNNKVKAIYAHYGFKVYANDNTANRLARPEPGVKVLDEGALRPYKAEWHRVKDMVLPVEEAEKFLAGLTEVVHPPPKLSKYIPRQV